ncbi:MAG: prepilin-type N-terminal cleavage/methylation domain-containing protein [Candidatus Pacebacteria bacterium]|nr:prepilin-type N-terminal cleavage/methylation domain-containing protein [Candidatus Paceibacterota bacterium]
MKYTVEMINFIRLKIRIFSNISKQVKKNRAFTLVELVVVLGILAILATVTLLVINPTELNRQARDAQRLSDLQTINSAIGLFQSYNYTLTGTANTVYISLPSNQADCSDLGLAALPAGWSYACKTSTNYRKIDSTGWIPVDFTQVQTSAGSLFAALPIDPTNTATGGLYYTYVKGSWALSAGIESAKFLADNATNDGGATTTRFEIGGGGDLVANGAWTAAAVEQTACGEGDTDGMVSYWKLDETSAGSVVDVMGANNGTNNGATINQTGQVEKAYSFDGGSDYISTFKFNSVNFTVSAWVKPSSLGSWMRVASQSDHNGAWVNSDFNLSMSPTGALSTEVFSNCGASSGGFDTEAVMNTVDWQYVVETYDGSTIKIYRNGVFLQSSSFLSRTACGQRSVLIGARWANNNEVDTTQYFNGLIDEAVIYNTALTGPAVSCAINDPDATIYDICKHYARGVAENPYCPYTP